MSQDSNVELALAGGMPQHFGWYRFYFEDERWEWSPEVARIHGYEPGSVTPTTRLVLRWAAISSRLSSVVASDG